MMDHARSRDRLDDFVDGALPEGEREAVRLHLEGCDECRAEAEELSSLLAAARALPREAAPGRDLWPEIAARIGGRRVIEVDFDRARPPARPAPRRWAPLAAAAVALVVLSSGLTYLLAGPPAAGPVALAPVSARPLTALAAFEPAEAEYLGTVELLEAALAARRAELQPSTVAVIEENLRIIDDAIAEARAALEAEPRNADLPLMLSGVYRKKVELLQAAIQIPIQS